MTDVAKVTWRVLLVEDNEEVARTTSAALRRRPVSLRGEHAAVEVVNSFEEALKHIEEQRFDLIVLDIRDQAAVEDSEDEAELVGDDATSADKGLRIYSEIRGRRFIPIVFYSAVAHLAADHHDPPFVTVVNKLDDGDNVLRDKVTEVFNSPLPLLNRALARHVNEVLRDFMIEFVEKNWPDLNQPAHRGDMAYLMVRRLAHSLDSGFIADLTDDAAPDVADDKVHPTRLYIVPPIGDLTTGDLLCTIAGEWFVLLTPACDLVAHGGKRKAEFAVMAHCLLVTETDEYKQWQQAGRPKSGGKLDRLIANRREGQQDRYYFLPGAWGRPDLIVDLQRLSHLPYDKLGEFERLATLDDPYAQSVVAQLGRFIGRMGTPDLDVDAVRARLPVLETQKAPAAAAPRQVAIDAEEPHEARVSLRIGKRSADATDVSSTEVLAGFSEPQPYTLDAVAAAPASSGVHVVIDRGKVIYVGSTGNLRRRLRQHLRGGRGSSVLHEQVGEVLDAEADGASASEIAAWLERRTISWCVSGDPESLKASLVLALKPRFNRRVPNPRPAN